MKEDLKPKKFGALFAKVPQDFRAENEIRREVLTKSFFPQKSDAHAGFSNQVAKLLYPTRYVYDTNNSRSWTNHVHFLNLPILSQPYDDYKILVATAPPNIHVGDNKRTLVYVIFPEDSQSASVKTGFSNVPTVYFVNERNSKMDLEKKGQADPIFIVDNNRTVTGLKSKEIAKFVRFRNKWTNRYDYKVAR